MAAAASGAEVAETMPFERARQESGQSDPSSKPEQEQHADEEMDCRDVLQDLLERPESSFGGQAVTWLLILVIIASTAAVIVETMPEFNMNPLFFEVEMVVTAIFTIEFALRVYVCNSPREFFCDCFNLIDFLATFPGYVELFLVTSHSTSEAREPSNIHSVHKAASSMRTLRMIRIVRLARVFRVMRIAKAVRYSQLLRNIISVFAKVSQSSLVVVLILMGIAMVLSASLTYVFESELCESNGIHCAGPSAFVSIPAAFWWAIQTLTTVGLGDIVPHTAAGKIIGGVTAIAGVIIVSIGIALVSTNFRECFIEEQEQGKTETSSRRNSRSDSKDRPAAAMADEVGEVQELLAELEARSSHLVGKLRSLAARKEDGVQLLMMVDVLSSHTNTLTSDVQVFIQSALAPAETGTPAAS